MKGIATITIHAPLANFVIVTITSTTPVVAAPMPLITALPLPASLLRPHPPSNHAGLRQREGGEHADHVELDQSRQVRVEGPDQHGGEPREHDHAVGEDEPVAAVAELRRHEAVAREDRGEPWEVLEGRVGREDQDARREHLQRAGT